MARGGGRNGRLIAVATAGLVAAALLPVPGGDGAVRTTDERVRALGAREARLAHAERSALLDLYALESELSGARTDLALVDARAASLALQQSRLLRQRAAVALSLATARRQLGQTIRTLYKHGEPDPVAIILGASSFDDAVARLDDLNRAARANRRLIADLHVTEGHLHVVDIELQSHRRALLVARDAAEAAIARLGRAAASRTQALTSLRARHDLTRRQIARLDALARAAQRRSARLAAHASAPTTTPATATAAPASPSSSHGALGTTRTLVVDAVAYHLPGKTASGLPVGMGVVAVDPTVIPLGTRMLVPGYGPAVAADVGSAVKGAVIDLWMPTRARALAWGRRTVTITLYG